MAIFLLLNGMGLAFLLYVLVNFWKEGHRAKGRVWPQESGSMRADGRTNLVVTHAMAHSVQHGATVIPFADAERSVRDGQHHRGRVDTTDSALAKRLSVR